MENLRYSEAQVVVDADFSTKQLAHAPDTVSGCQKFIQL